MVDIFQESQPDFLPISERLQLKKFNDIVPQALGWYQDEETLRLVDGPGRDPYSEETLVRMYSVLNQLGELYYIEYKTDNEFRPIGDVTLAIRDLPIVIGDSACRGKGIGFQVVQALIKRAFNQGMKELYVREIYGYNTASQKLFEKCGFIRDMKTKLGYSYRLMIE